MKCNQFYYDLTPNYLNESHVIKKLCKLSALQSIVEISLWPQLCTQLIFIASIRIVLPGTTYKIDRSAPAQGCCNELCLLLHNFQPGFLFIVPSPRCSVRAQKVKKDLVS